MSTISYVIIVLCIILLVRNSLVYRILGRRNKEVHARNLRAIDSGFTNMYILLQDYASADYNWMLFDITKWTYREFFPENIREYSSKSEQA